MPLIRKKKKTTEAVPEIPQAPVPVAPTPQPEVVPQQIPEVPTPEPQVPEATEDLTAGPWSVQNVATQTQEVIYNSETDETLSVQQVLVRLMNLLESEE